MDCFDIFININMAYCDTRIVLKQGWDVLYERKGGVYFTSHGQQELKNEQGAEDNSFLCKSIDN